jgi:hypothetical protein
MSETNEKLSGESIVLEKERAKYNVAKAGYETANEELVENINNFYQLAGFNYNNLPNTNLVKNADEEVHGKGEYCIHAYDWIDDPSSSDLIKYNQDSSYYKMRAGIKYSARLEITPNATTTSIGFHTNGGNYGLGG